MSRFLEGEEAQEGKMIVPTVGRVVWFRAFGSEMNDQPHAAIVTKVWNNRVVNLAVFDEDGEPYRRTSVCLVQEGDTVPVNGEYPNHTAGMDFAMWMPYQVGQAKKHEAETTG